MARNHGTRARYVFERCRCEPCRKANREYARARDRRRRRPDAVDVSTAVPAGPVRAHLAELRASGLGRRRISDLSGVSQSAITAIAQGRRAKVTRDVADRLYGVFPAERALGAHVDATATHRRIAALRAAGWTNVAIARRVHGPAAKALQIGKQRVTERTAASVKALADEVLHSPVSGALPRVPRASHNDSVGDLGDSLDEPLDPDLDSELRGVLDVVLAGHVREPDGPGPGLEGHESSAVPGGQGSGSWRDQAECRDPEIPNWLFFPETGAHDVAAQARAVCARCTVRVECLEYALAEHLREGIWGGTSPMQRRALYRGMPGSGVGPGGDEPGLGDGSHDRTKHDPRSPDEAFAA